MAKDKDRALNPAAAQRKAEKQKALKKGKAAVAAQRTERYANRNPHRLESQIADLQALKESQGGKLSVRDQKQLAEAEKDVARVKKAREALGDKAPTFKTNREPDDGVRGRGRGVSGRGRYGGLGKRGREQEEISGEETDESTRRIPWPKDTPPPIPRQQQRQDRPRHSTNANSEPLGADRQLSTRADGAQSDQKLDTTLPPKPAVRTTYESAPQVRDLKKEATARFVPTAVKRKIDATKGKRGTLLEEDEVQRLEKEGYGAAANSHDAAGESGVRNGVVVGAAPEVSEEEDAARRLREEEERFSRELEMVEELGEEGEGSRGVRMEEVSDEDM